MLPRCTASCLVALVLPVWAASFDPLYSCGTLGPLIDQACRLALLTRPAMIWSKPHCLRHSHDAAHLSMHNHLCLSGASDLACIKSSCSDTQPSHFKAFLACLPFLCMA